METFIIIPYQTSHGLKNEQGNCVVMTELFQYLEWYIARLRLTIPPYIYIAETLASPFTRLQEVLQAHRSPLALCP